MGRRWGIVGTGRMARALVSAIREEGGEVVAVSSSDRSRAQAFADTHGIARAHAGHHRLVDDPDLDAVYVATTNDRHHADVLACVAAGHPVLAEKPFALNLAQAEEMVDAARAAGVFLMEAMWMRFQPAFLEVERRVAAGQIGEPRSVQADLGFAADRDPTGRLFTSDLGGGSLLDVGVYPLTFAISFLGTPTAGVAVATLDAGVDTQANAALRHDQGTSSIACSLVTDSGMEATVSGPEGSLRLAAPFHHSGRITRRVRGEIVEEFPVPDADLRYRLEVREVHRCLDEGLIESPRMPWSFTLEVMDWLDRLRAQIGVRYPQEGEWAPRRDLT